MEETNTSGAKHVHGPLCGHVGILHHDHIDYLHEGKLQHQAGSDVVNHSIEVSTINPDECIPTICSGRHEDLEEVPHGDHIDFLVEGRLHHVHGDHCDDHGPVVAQ